ncbi:CDP-alcohol phosphatidyltransferase family protein [Krasilnikovia sp. MM14-A1004]|uniref:CDP-alcohol phosphatidyltransferase family protein n=1 Tax=Krasilnikovia sp. MM14-A1004 TaxID=3373541 RepID=UPI00399CB4D5
MTIGRASAPDAPSRGAAAGLLVLTALLAALSATVGIGAVGWLAGLAYGLVLTGALVVGARRTGLRRLGAANVVTLSRALLVGGVTALVAYSFQRPAPTAVLVALVGVALALDGVDGQVARRTGSTTALGARFDMEVDAFLILVLSVYVAGPLGWWTVAMGAYRYVFVAASWALPWMSRPLPPRFSRKVVAATQGVVLVVATASVLPTPVNLVVVAAALTSLTWSFVRDTAWLWRTEQAHRAVLATLPLTPVRARPITVATGSRRPTPVPASVSA